MVSNEAFWKLLKTSELILELESDISKLNNKQSNNEAKRKTALPVREPPSVAIFQETETHRQKLTSEDFHSPGLNPESVIDPEGYNKDIKFILNWKKNTATLH